MYFGEYGADAYNANTHQEDQQAQAAATSALTHEINGQSSLNGGPCIGGLLFEFADEWWKDAAGTNTVQDIGGIAPGAGPYPDNVFNEEWWGLVTIDRTPRQAYNAYKAMARPGDASMPTPLTA